MAKGTTLTKDSNGARVVGNWVEGILERSIWTGYKTKGKSLLPITTYRCGKCGLLENYAEG
ncbi:hypothetical protein GCM10009127_26800 [Alteraurantiacibacter aestuarii]|uniref:Uncharacterized protein n=1 Tax=Alteraurantiacibacter aestuarii TaxID=650004 RepID=A0A844ZK19_9SPHN|nr:hypothetical protein [Alteraurantiacibacter aestuarii]MXO88791.1 hypothetical protein [Alteraurantiacibacter aestuarii]